jgi:hypothetical protein
MDQVVFPIEWIIVKKVVPWKYLSYLGNKYFWILNCGKNLFYTNIIKISYIQVNTVFQNETVPESLETI